VQALPSQWQSRLRWALTLALAFSPLEPQDSAILLALMAVNILRTRATGHGRHFRTALCGLDGMLSYNGRHLSDIVHTDWFVYCEHCNADHLADVVCVIVVMLCTPS